MFVCGIDTSQVLGPKVMNRIQQLPFSCHNLLLVRKRSNRNTNWLEASRTVTGMNEKKKQPKTLGWDKQWQTTNSLTYGQGKYIQHSPREWAALNRPRSFLAQVKSLFFYYVWHMKCYGTSKVPHINICQLHEILHQHTLKSTRKPPKNEKKHTPTWWLDLEKILPTKTCRISNTLPNGGAPSPPSPHG